MNPSDWWWWDIGSRGRADPASWCKTGQHMQTHALHTFKGGVAFSESHYSHSVITFWWDMSPGRFLKPISHPDVLSNCLGAAVVTEIDVKLAYLIIPLWWDWSWRNWRGICWNWSKVFEQYYVITNRNAFLRRIFLFAVWTLCNWLSFTGLHAHVWPPPSGEREKKSFLHTFHKPPRLSKWPFDLNI